MHPILLHTEHLVIPSYYLVISLTYSLGVLWVVHRAKTMKVDLRLSLDLCLAIMVGGFAGARLFHVFYEYPDYYWNDPWAVFRFWEGGFVFFGGFLGAMAACEAFLLIKNEPFPKWGDFFAPVLAAGYALGRIGCFLAGCCYGAACDLPWAVSFPGGVEAPAEIPRHPTQLYATFWELAVVGLLLYLEKRRKKQKGPGLFAKPGAVFYVWIVLHGIGRLLMEAFRADNRGIDIFGLSISSLISLLLIIFGFAALIRHASNSSSVRQ